MKAAVFCGFRLFFICYNNTPKFIIYNRLKAATYRLTPINEERDTMANDILIGPYEKISGRPFTNLDHSVMDRARLVRMTEQLVDTYHDPEVCDFSKCKKAVFQIDSEGNEFKIYYIRPKELFSYQNIFVVGFFGHRRPNADIAPLIRADKKFKEIFLTFDGLLSLSTTQLPSGDFANLVLFTDDEAKDRWNYQPDHYDTVSKISPPYYSNVRLNNGILPNGVKSPELLKLTKVRYLDYTVSPHWRAVRKIETLPNLD